MVIPNTHPQVVVNLDPVRAVRLEAVREEMRQYEGAPMPQDIMRRLRRKLMEQYWRETGPAKVCGMGSWTGGREEQCARVACEWHVRGVCRGTLMFIPCDVTMSL